MRYRYIQDPKTGELVPADEYTSQAENMGAMIMSDIKPYRSMVTGEMIEGRAQHREHLKKHGLIEVGNETKYLTPKERNPDPRIRETVARIVYEKLRYR